MKTSRALGALTAVVIVLAVSAPAAFAADEALQQGQQNQTPLEMRLGRRLDRKGQRMERRHNFIEEHASELTEEEKTVLKNHHDQMVKERQARRDAWHQELQQKYPALWAKMQNWFPKMTEQK
jgi:hypothetical protein